MLRASKRGILQKEIDHLKKVIVLDGSIAADIMPAHSDDVIIKEVGEIPPLFIHPDHVNALFELTQKLGGEDTGFQSLYYIKDFDGKDVNSLTCFIEFNTAYTDRDEVIQQLIDFFMTHKESLTAHLNTLGREYPTKELEQMFNGMQDGTINQLDISFAVKD